jgi:predicted RND superfamily exporter protein
MSERFGSFVIRHRLSLLVLIILVSLPMLWLARTSRLSHKAGHILPWGHHNVNLHIKMTKVFGRNNLVAITLRTTKNDIFNPETLSKIYRLQKAVELMDGIVKYNIYSIASPKLHYLQTSTDPDGIMLLGAEKLSDMLQKILAGDRDLLETYRKNILNDADIYGNLVSRDGKGAVIIASFKYEEDYQYIFRHLKKITALEEDAQTEFYLVGRPIMLGYIHQYMARILWIFGLALLVMMVLLYSDFRRKRAVILPLTAGLLSVVWGMGILNLSGFEMDVLSITVPFLVLALSLGHSVQIMQRYYEEGHRHRDARTASRQVIATLLLPASTSIITDSIGFISLALLPFPIIQTMAVVAAAGILSIWITNFIFIPVILSYLPLPTERELERVERSGPLVNSLAWLGKAVCGGRSRTVILIAAALVCIAGLLAARGLQVGEQQPGSPNFWQDSEYNRGDRIMNKHFVGTNLLWIYLAGMEHKDLLKPEVITYFNNLQQYLEERPEVNYTLSYVDALKKVNSALHNNDPRWEIMPTNKIAAWECLELIMGEPEERRDVFELDLRQANIRAFVSDHTGATIRSLMQDIRRYVRENPPPGIEVDMAAGLIGIYEAVLDEISRSQIKNLAFMLVAVFLCSAIAFRSVTAGLLIIVPLIVGNIITFAVMALSGVGLFIYTLPVSALGIGVGVDYSLYILSRLKREIGQADLQLAYSTTFRTAGRAVLFTALTVTAGVTILWISEMRFQAILGIMLGVIMMANMLSGLLVLPALLSMLKPKFLFAAQVRQQEQQTP